MSVLTIIPARGGSKGIPLKNIQPILGKPMLAYSIEHAKLSPSVDRVVVSTDSEAIASVASAYGAEVIWRPAQISTDTASSEAALLHALDYLRDTEAYEPELVVFLQATSPIRQADDIEKSIHTLRAEGADSLFSACRVHGFVWRLEGGELRSLSYDYRERVRRQDAPEDLLENGSIYVFKPWVLRTFNNRLGGKIAVYRMHPLDSFQVDEPDDLEIIERLMRLRTPGFVPDLSCVRMLVLDFDGVMTDNRVLVDEEGRESVWCSRADGWGIARVKESGVDVVVLSTETNPVVSSRCRKLGVECVQSCADKMAALRRLVEKKGLRPDEVAYVGNDVNDIECMRWVGMPIAVADAEPGVAGAARFVTRRCGGHGAVREVCDMILTSRRIGNG
jgi:N-acylneuraminate cytidylyltransferase